MPTPRPGSTGRFVGVDLAWGDRARTGLAVLDPTGRLLASGSVRTDQEIADWIDRQASGDVTVAVDAPLIVPNEMGRRPCEAAVGRAFARHDAGAYPANRGNPVFRPQPRGARLAERFGWTMDPGVRPATGLRTCIEVYPHPAMVVLFGLDRILPYKIKPGRDLVALLRAYGLLLGHLERVCGVVLRLAESGRWQQLRREAQGAGRKADLAAIEDELDGIFCAYLAFLWATQPDRMAVLGDVVDGYIVVPTAVPMVAPGPSGGLPLVG